MPKCPTIAPAVNVHKSTRILRVIGVPPARKYSSVNSGGALRHLGTRRLAARGARRRPSDPFQSPASHSSESVLRSAPGGTIMQTRGNTILITGGGSGIGRGLAEAFQREGNQVVIAGRRKQALDQTTAANPGMKSALLDIANAEATPRFAEELKRDYPALNV